jgi:hypothetical protein
VTVLLGSLALPIAFATTTASAAGLVTIHLAVAVVAITGLAWVPPRPQGTPGAADTRENRGTHWREDASAQLNGA